MSDGGTADTLSTVAISLAAENARLRAEIARLQEWQRRVAHGFSDPRYQDRECPDCRGTLGGHGPRCGLAQLLSECPA